MGLAAAAAVTVAVLIALTLVPAIALLFGERMRPRSARPPKPAKNPKKAKKAPKPKKSPSQQHAGFSNTWVHAITRFPVVTIIAVLVLLGLAAVPALSMRLSLPDNSTAPIGSDGPRDLRQDHRGVR